MGLLCCLVYLLKPFFCSRNTFFYSQIFKFAYSFAFSFNKKHDFWKLTLACVLSPEVHTMLDALLPPDTYFRFNPHMSEDIPLNESRAERLNFLKSEGNRYLERNEAKLRKAASVLSQEKSTIQRVAEWAKLKADMYEGLPFVSKL